MSARLLLLCPGQGGQHAGMFDLARSDPAAAALLEHGGSGTHVARAHPACEGDAGGPAAVARARLDKPPFSEPPAALFANRSAQPLIVAATLAMWQALRDATPAPALVAGYSIGELAAWSVAGAIAPLDAIELANTRATLMDACLARHPGQALLAVMGLPQPLSAAHAARAGFHVAIAIGEDSCILGGLAARTGDIEAALTAAGARVTRLPVEIASHTPYMADAVVPFAGALRAARLQPPVSPVLSGISAARLDRPDQAVEHLSRQLGEKIVWDECMDACAEAGITAALELGPGAALSRMLQARHPGIACRSVADFRSLDGIRAWLRRQTD
ncbi:acyltransferase domain-containing protein [Pseudoduganella sp. LjRoot289]|uniref:ACP S-malonyltransferase n=1 Tax=Pseudoduganella sp. LjRoot289 TaxID=3342314 RepID=UPI003ED0E337